MTRERGAPAVGTTAMSLPRYLFIRGLGLVMFCLGLIGLGFVAIAFFQSGIGFVWVLALIVGLSSTYLVTSLAFSRRARVAEDRFVPSILPFPGRFRLHTPELHLREISEVRNRMAGDRLIGLAFRMRDGETYLILRAIVGRDLFEHLLKLKHRFYDSEA